MVRSTTGRIPSGAQFLRIPKSDVSNWAGPEQASVGIGEVCVTIKLPPFGSGALGHPVKVQLPTWTATELTVTGAPLLLTICTAPASNVQVAVDGQPSKVVLGEPAHGVGKFVALARTLSAYPTNTPIPE